MKNCLRAWLSLLVVALFSGLPAIGFAADAAEGKEFVRLKMPQSVESGNKIEVIEFFSYGCPHCKDLEPFLSAWVKKLPGDVQFKRIPVMFQERWVGLAKLYYTLEALGDEQRLASDVFAGIHNQNLQLFQEKAFLDWVSQKGVDRTKASDIYNSFAINSKINRAKVLAQAYNIQAVPTIIVDGKYATESSRAGGHPKIPEALDVMISKARQERSKS